VAIENSLASFNPISIWAVFHFYTAAVKIPMSEKSNLHSKQMICLISNNGYIIFGETISIVLLKQYLMTGYTICGSYIAMRFNQWTSDDYIFRHLTPPRVYPADRVCPIFFEGIILLNV
jgi:hypothetical protein